MRKKIPLPGGDLERAILRAVWQLGTPTAREVHESLPESERVYTTTAKVLDRLTAKGLLRRAREGRMFRYHAAIKRESVERAGATESVTRLLADDPKPAMATLVDAVEAIDPGLLEELARAVAAKRRTRRGS